MIKCRETNCRCNTCHSRLSLVSGPSLRSDPATRSQFTRFESAAILYPLSSILHPLLPIPRSLPPTMSASALRLIVVADVRIARVKSAWDEFEQFLKVQAQLEIVAVDFGNRLD